MSTSFVVIGKQVTKYVGIPIFVSGVVGGLLNLAVFFSLRTFRQSSCAFYLTIMSFVNIGQLFSGFLPLRIIYSLLNVNGTETSLFFCKFQVYLSQLCIGASFTCFCLAIIDQYLATCAHPRWQQLCNIKLAHRLIIICILFWMLHGILPLIFYNHIQSPITNKTSCTTTNTMFNNYRDYFFIPVLNGYMPIIIAGLFGVLAYRNIQQISYRTIPIVRRELDKQLTIMVLLQVFINIFILLPYTTIVAVATNISLTSDPIIQAKLQFTITIVVVIYNIYFSSSFYIYICASKRFRKQFLHVMYMIYSNRWKQPRLGDNQVMPET
ncbi:unnamed protein product [Adineta steineri]|uniref:G-protein coupled receptors family 1 profile domain-containing protein n=1 Tax=Adineta steineri TaxID=433720 RepID=A0A815IAG3_9BILA|nr:unnamed protein product [Adineta steineri]CAF3834567.1 unnamed protein product [Adineta steineri]